MKLLTRRAQTRLKTVPINVSALVSSAKSVDDESDRSHINHAALWHRSTAQSSERMAQKVDRYQRSQLLLWRRAPEIGVCSLARS